LVALRYGLASVSVAAALGLARAPFYISICNACELAIQSQRTESRQLLISVTDTGIGLPPQQRGQIVDAFFTAKADGTGMGLRISRAIVESHGGRLWAGDNSPRGARFAFTLPVKIEGRYEARRRHSSYIPKYDGATTNG